MEQPKVEISEQFKTAVLKAISEGVPLRMAFPLADLPNAGRAAGIDPWAEIKAGTRFGRHVVLQQEQTKYAIWAARRVAYNLVTASKMPGQHEVRYLWHNLEHPNEKIIPQLQAFHVAPHLVEFGRKLVEARLREDL